MNDAVRYGSEPVYLSPDGVFGSNTYRDVQAFQAHNFNWYGAYGIHPDGVVGDQTWKKMCYVQKNSGFYKYTHFYYMGCYVYGIYE
jgi:hypothetical protein